MKSLDLFSGLGGITHALRGYFEPTMYCDIDKWAQAVLARLIDTGKLPPAPLYADVRSVGRVDESVRAIVGGSPCQSISVMGQKAGIAEGTKSGLFFEIVRIVDENPQIDVLFLENVSNILRLGAREVVDSLAARNFSMSWILRHARGHGAPHKRMRWFCLAVRDGADVPELRDFARASASFPRWSSETEPPRVAVRPEHGHDPNYSPDWVRRQSLLGNSVVPVTVRGAFEELAERYHRWESLGETLVDMGTHYKEWTSDMYPQHALVWKGRVIQLPVIAQDLSRVWKPSITLDFCGTLLALKSYPTPRGRNPRASRFTRRALNDLGTVLINSMEAQIYVASSGLRITGDSAIRMCDTVVPNTTYVEFMMGYEPDWTSFQYPPGMQRSTWPVDTPTQTSLCELEAESDVAPQTDIGIEDEVDPIVRDAELDEIEEIVDGPLNEGVGEVAGTDALDGGVVTTGNVEIEPIGSAAVGIVAGA